MRKLVVLLTAMGTVSVVCWGQAMADYAAAATGATAGAAAGKPVSDALTRALGNAGGATEKAAHHDREVPPVRTEVSQPKIEGGASSPAAASGGSYSASARRGSIRRPVSAPAAAEEATTSSPSSTEPPAFEFGGPVLSESDVPATTFADALPNPAPQPPPEMTPESFSTVVVGMNRAELLRLGAPASKITMDEDGHVLEVYTYQQTGMRVGTIRLVDGSVSTIRQ